MTAKELKAEGKKLKQQARDKKKADKKAQEQLKSLIEKQRKVKNYKTK